jgi:pyruvate/2-oxoglutarate dehydrogenase complex dihydrolipoamide dehydrogenase (E3) component
MNHYDFIAIGGGSAGFNAARVAVALGKKVAVVDGARPLGGLCILRGCMPSKTLLYSAEVLHRAQQGRVFGLKIPRASADMKAVHARKKRLIAGFARYRVRQLTTGGFDLHRRRASFVDAHTLALSDGTRLRADRFLIATGSKAGIPPVPGLADVPFWISDDVLELDCVPASVIVLGGGVVACELAQFLRRMGSRVVMIQRGPHILRDHSPEAAGIVRQAFRDEGIEMFAGTRIRRVSHGRRGFRVAFEQDGRLVIRQARRLLNALGREPNTAGLHLDAAGVRVDSGGRVLVNRWQQSSRPHIYAAGDACGPHDIVHLAIAQGELAARHACGVPRVRPVDHSLLLNVVFTEPQLATIGRREGDLQARRVRHLCASYPFSDHGKAILMEASHGFVKVIAEPAHGRILGAEIVGPDAGELIHCFSGPLAMRATVFDLLRAPWYHPTLAEIITYPLEEIAARIGVRPGRQWKTK